MTRGAGAGRRRLLIALAAELVCALAVGSGWVWWTRPVEASCFPRPGFAVGSSLSRLSDADRDARLDRIAATGVDRIRLDVSWAEIQPRRPVPGDDGRDPDAVSRMDRTLDAARARGFEVLGILAYAPEWARGPLPAGSPALSGLPDDPQQMVPFVREAAHRWGDRIGAWEVWNEPNLLMFGYPVDAGRYAAVVRAVAAALHEVTPDTPVAAGALAPSTDSSGNRATLDFADEMLSAGLGPDVDALSVHPYAFPHEPALRSWRSFAPVAPGFTMVERVREASEEAGLPLPIWVTEFGAPTGTTRFAGEVVTVSDDEQARWTSDAGRRLAATGYVERFYVYNDVDLPHEPIDGVESAEAHFGVYRADGSPKPAAGALRELACR